MHRTAAFRQSLARRFREIRECRFGADDDAVARLATALGIPAATWKNIEAGVVMPANILLKFLEVTGVDHRWLSTGEGDRYADPRPEFGLRVGGMSPDGNR